MAQTKFPEISGMALVVSTFILLAVNVVVLTVAQTVFPKYIALGTHALSYPWALFMSMSALSLLTTFILPLVSRFENSRQKLFTPTEWMTLYFIVNSAGIWTISRFSEQFGLGVTSWGVVLGLALVLDIFQGMAMTAYGAMMKK